ncbi:MAG: SHOCT domain-containing protein [Acidimicrobiales bacterium]
MGNCCGGWMGVGWLVFLAILILGVVLLVRALSGKVGREEGSARGPLEILSERFARGEIDREEFEERHRILRS